MLETESEGMCLLARFWTVWMRHEVYLGKWKPQRIRFCRKRIYFTSTWSSISSRPWLQRKCQWFGISRTHCIHWQVETNNKNQDTVCPVFCPLTGCSHSLFTVKGMLFNILNANTIVHTVGFDFRRPILKACGLFARTVHALRVTVSCKWTNAMEVPPNRAMKAARVKYCKTKPWLSITTSAPCISATSAQRQSFGHGERMLAARYKLYSSIIFAEKIREMFHCTMSFMDSWPWDSQADLRTGVQIPPSSATLNASWLTAQNLFQWLLINYCITIKLLLYRSWDETRAEMRFGEDVSTSLKSDIAYQPRSVTMSPSLHRL